MAYRCWDWYVSILGWVKVGFESDEVVTSFLGALFTIHADGCWSLRTYVKLQAHYLLAQRCSCNASRAIDAYFKLSILAIASPPSNPPRLPASFLSLTIQTNGF